MDDFLSVTNVVSFFTKLVFIFTVTLHHCNTIHEICFHFLVWLVKDPRLYFPLNQEIPQSTRCQKGKSLENVCLWETDIANLRKNFILKVKFDAVCQVELKVSHVSLLPSLFVIHYHPKSMKEIQYPNLCRIQQMRTSSSKAEKSKKFKDVWNPLSGERQLSQNAKEGCL